MKAYRKPEAGVPQASPPRHLQATTCSSDCEAGMKTGAAIIAREHLDASLAAPADRLSPATVAKHYRSMQQLFRRLVGDGETGHSPWNA